ncbi:hypothetical protein OF83DRAFT_1127245 [Amylostereum chailletii]|nr:hypothetical protein OF83DRAFT_1127245 [Amylostereum chailletii]
MRHVHTYVRVYVHGSPRIERRNRDGAFGNLPAAGTGKLAQRCCHAAKFSSKPLSRNTFPPPTYAGKVLTRRHRPHVIHYTRARRTLAEQHGQDAGVTHGHVPRPPAHIETTGEDQILKRAP